MRHSISPAQIVGSLLATLLGAHAASLTVGYLASDWFSFSNLEGAMLAALILSLVAFGIFVIAGIAGLVAVILRQPTASKAAGVLLLLAAGCVVIETVLRSATYKSQYGIGYGDLLSYWGWPGSEWWLLLAAGIAAIASVLCFIGRGPVAHQRVAQPATFQPMPGPFEAAAPPPLPNNHATFWISVDTVDYGPYSAEQIRSFVAEGRVTRQSMIKPTNGYYQRAAEVPGLFN